MGAQVRFSSLPGRRGSQDLVVSQVSIGTPLHPGCQAGGGGMQVPADGRTAAPYRT